jgi:hypothetical protein
MHLGNARNLRVRPNTARPQGEFRFFSGLYLAQVQDFPDFNRSGFNTELGYAVERYRKPEVGSKPLCGDANRSGDINPAWSAEGITGSQGVRMPR